MCMPSKINIERRHEHSIGWWTHQVQEALYRYELIRKTNGNEQEGLRMVSGNSMYQDYFVNRLIEVFRGCPTKSMHLVNKWTLSHHRFCEVYWEGSVIKVGTQYLLCSRSKVRWRRIQLLPSACWSLQWPTFWCFPNIVRPLVSALNTTHLFSQWS